MTEDNKDLRGKWDFQDDGERADSIKYEAKQARKEQEAISEADMSQHRASLDAVKARVSWLATWARVAGFAFVVYTLTKAGILMALVEKIGTHQ